MQDSRKVIRLTSHLKQSFEQQIDPASFQSTEAIRALMRWFISVKPEKQLLLVQNFGDHMEPKPETELII